MLRAFAEILSLRSSGKPSRNAPEKAAVHSCHSEIDDGNVRYAGLSSSSLHCLRTAVERTNTFWGGAGERARKVAQAYECERFFEAIRSLVHRFEGGNSNAVYWDRCAGTDVARPYPYAKWALLAEEAVRG